MLYYFQLLLWREILSHYYSYFFSSSKSFWNILFITYVFQFVVMLFGFYFLDNHISQFWKKKRNLFLMIPSPIYSCLLLKHCTSWIGSLVSNNLPFSLHHFSLFSMWFSQLYNLNVLLLSFVSLLSRAQVCSMYVALYSLLFCYHGCKISIIFWKYWW